MFPLGDNCFVAASVAGDPATGARYRAARLLEGLSPQEVAERGNHSKIVLQSQGRESGGYELTAELVVKLEQDPSRTAIWVFAAVSHALGKHPSEIMEMDLTHITPKERDQ